MVESAIEWVALPLVVVLLAASAFFSSTEVAIFSLPAELVPSKSSEGDGRTRALSTLRGDPHRLLVTLLVGNTLVNVALSSVITVAAANAFPPGVAVVVATVGASAVVLVFGEILPKSFGLGHAERWALSSARTVAVLQVLLYPIVAFFDVVTRRIARLVGGSPAIERPYTE